MAEKGTIQSQLISSLIDEAGKMFFEAERHNFFRPLNGKRRELVVACLHALYERLHGPGADYANNMSREALRDLITPIIQTTANQFIADDFTADDELSRIDATDDQQLAGALIRKRPAVPPVQRV